MEITVFKKKIDLLKVKEFVISMIGIFLLAMTIVFLIGAQNEIYQTLKDIQYAKAFFMLAAFMFVTKRVRLINWQSLVVSAVYWPFGYMYRESRGFAPDLFNRDKVVVWIVWMLLMIAVDMIVYKKYTPLQKFNKKSLVLFALMTMFLIFFRNGRNYPLVLIMAFIFYLIPMTMDKWKQVVNQFCYGHLLAFAIILYRSLVNNPQVHIGNGRWYGDFINIGDFGLFMGGVTAVILYQLYQNKKEKGRKSLGYVFWMIALAVCIWVICRISTLTYFVGIFLVFLVGFIAIRKDATVKNSLYRCVSVVIGLCVIGIIGFLALKGLANTDAAYWHAMVREGNDFIKPVAEIIDRAHYVFDGTRTFANCDVFEPDSFINYLDLFTSGRFSIIKMFSEYFNVAGNPSMGLQVGEYFAYNTHNTYSQAIFDYGYIGGGLYIVFFIYCMFTSAIKYIKEKQNVQVFTCVWLAMLLGVLNGESANLYFPIMVMTLLAVYPLIVEVEKKAE